MLRSIDEIPWKKWTKTLERRLEQSASGHDIKQKKSKSKKNNEKLYE